MGAGRLLLGNRRFLVVWLLGGLTGVFRWMQILAFGVHTFQISESPLLVSSVAMLWMLPLVLCGPFIGVIADRLNRKRLLLGSLSMALAVSVAMLVASYADALTFPYIAVASVVGGMFWATDMPVRRRLLGDVAAGELAGGTVATAMSLDSATSTTTRMAGPLLGGVVLQVFGLTGVFMLSAVLLAVSLFAIAVTRLPGAPIREQSRHFVGEFVSGIRFVAGDPRLRWVFAITLVFNIWGFPFTSMIPVIGADRLGLGAAMTGLLSSMDGLGAIVGAIIVAFAARPSRYARLYFWGTTAYLALIGCLGILSLVCQGSIYSFLAASVILLALGFAGACYAAMQSTLSYLNARPEYRSRVLGVLTLCIGTGIAGFLHIGWLAEAFGAPVALMTTAAEGLLALLVLWLGGVKYDASRVTPGHGPA